MAVFPATYFTFSTRYPESGSRMSLGRSYVYTQAPEAPDQRIFQLELQGMKYFVDINGTIDNVSTPERNMAVLEDFYVLHRLHETFDFPHPVYGTIKCKFNRPLEIPAGVRGGNGLLPEFQVELLEIL